MKMLGSLAALPAGLGCQVLAIGDPVDMPCDRCGRSGQGEKHTGIGLFAPAAGGGRRFFDKPENRRVEIANLSQPFRTARVASRQADRVA